MDAQDDLPTPEELCAGLRAADAEHQITLDKAEREVAYYGILEKIAIAYWHRQDRWDQWLDQAGIGQSYSKNPFHRLIKHARQDNGAQTTRIAKVLWYWDVVYEGDDPAPGSVIAWLEEGGYIKGRYEDAKHCWRETFPPGKQSDDAKPPPTPDEVASAEPIESPEAGEPQSQEPTPAAAPCPVPETVEAPQSQEAAQQPELETPSRPPAIQRETEPAPAEPVAAEPNGFDPQSPILLAPLGPKLNLSDKNKELARKLAETVFAPGNTIAHTIAALRRYHAVNPGWALSDLGIGRYDQEISQLKADRKSAVNFYIVENDRLTKENDELREKVAKLAADLELWNKLVKGKKKVA
jgi:hypothetical protein